MRRAYSYIRFSTPDQAKGDSLRRQTEAAKGFCERHKLVLDDTLNLCDMGVSAFKGKNAAVGNLGAFLEAVRTGKVPHGSVLIVENLDRLSREKLSDALDRVRGLLQAGIDIAKLTPERVYTRKDLDEPFALMELVLDASRAHQESDMKSRRLHSAWEAKRQRACEKRLTRICPAWLRPADDGNSFKVNQKAANAVRRIYQMARNGYGQQVITAKLNRERVPPIGRSGDFWRKAYVTKLLQSRAVVGEFQPHVKRDGKSVPHGKPIPGYFPAIITEDEWQAARHGIALRATQRGPRGTQVRNLFTGLIHDARDGSTMAIKSESPKRNRVPVISSYRAQHGESQLPQVCFPYQKLEAYILHWFDQEEVAELLRDSNGKEEEMTGLAAELVALDSKIQRAKRKYEEEPESEELLSVIVSLEKKKNTKSEALERLRRERSSSNAEALGELRSIMHLMGEAPPEETTEFRTRLKARIRLLVESIWVLIEMEGKLRVAHVQVFFRNGKEMYFQAQHRRTRRVGRIVKVEGTPTLFGDWAQDFSKYHGTMSRLPRLGDLRTWRDRHPPRAAVKQKKNGQRRHAT